MPPANIDFESDTERQEIWRRAMTDWTAEAARAIYPEAGFTATVTMDRRASSRRNNIPEPRLDMISGIPIPARSDRRPMPAETPAQWEATPDHDTKNANRAVQLIAGQHMFRAEFSASRRSGTGDAGSRASRVPSLPTFAIHHFRQPAIPDGGRSAIEYVLHER